MVNRAKPKMPQQAYKTFQVLMPRATHTRPASCEEVGCTRFLKGWKTSFVAGTPDGDKIRYQIKNSPIKRKYTVVRLPDRVEVLFPAGQQCFVQDHPSTQHRVPVGRPQIHVVRQGDWRTSVRDYLHSRRVHSDPRFWVEEFAENQDKLRTQVERG